MRQLHVRAGQAAGRKVGGRGKELHDVRAMVLTVQLMTTHTAHSRVKRATSSCSR